MAAAFHAHAATVKEKIDDKKRCDEDRDDRKFPVEVKKQDHDAKRHGEIADERDGGAGHDLVDRPRVVDHARDDAAGLPFLVKAEREFLQMREDRHPHVARHPHARGLHDMVADEQAAGAQTEHGGIKKEQRFDVRPAVRIGRPVDDAAVHPRRHERAKCDGDDEQEKAQKPQAIGLQVNRSPAESTPHFGAGASAWHC